jgi:ubiquinone/menaquinone biosynthesis C-methylase UbiE
MAPGSESFYEWVCRQPAYYPSTRWEYAEFDSMIEAAIRDGQRFRVLDVGCGSGRFLRRLKDKFGEDIECVGVDITPGALSQADQNEIRFILGDHREIAADSIGACDLVTSFHCLEHVADPLSFVRGMLGFVRQGGTVAVSTPLSPMSFEFEWKAIMNRPPHHMSRWNETAYSELASQLGLTVEFRSEEASGALGRTSNSVNKAVNGYQTGQSKLQRYVVMLMHPLTTIRHLGYQLSRPKLNGRDRGEDILSIFSQKDPS